MADNPWWYPQLVDAELLAGLRKDYPESAHLSDEELAKEYECNQKYAVYWDHVGEAYEEYEKVADRMLELEKEVERLGGLLRDRRLAELAALRAPRHLPVYTGMLPNDGVKEAADAIQKVYSKVAEEPECPKP